MIKLIVTFYLLPGIMVDGHNSIAVSWDTRGNCQEGLVWATDYAKNVVKGITYNTNFTISCETLEKP